MSNLRIRLNLVALGVYAFGFVLTYLAGLSFAGVLEFIFYFYFFFPLAAFILQIYLFTHFGYYENFSTEHPAKGEEVFYTLKLANESIFSSAFIKIKFKVLSPNLSFNLNPQDLVLKPKESNNYNYTLKFPYRGIYKVGLDYLEITDLLGWFCYRPFVWFRTFYVYPRLVELDSVFPSLQNIIESSGRGQGIISDYTLYHELREYKPGLPLRHIAWKKFAATGQPFLREYEKTSWPGLTIYLDLQREENEVNPQILEREDCSVEILVALVNYFLKQNIPLLVQAANEKENYAFSAKDQSLFESFYKSTLNLNFSGSISPVSVFKADLQNHAINSGTVLFITHRFDYALFELLSRNEQSDLVVFAIINEANQTESEIKKHQAFIQNNSTLAKYSVFVLSSQSIKEDLQQ